MGSKPTRCMRKLIDIKNIIKKKKKQKIVIILKIFTHRTYLVLFWL